MTHQTCTGSHPTRRPVWWALPLALGVGLLAPGAARAQPFSSGSDGNDGALALTVAQHGTDFVFDPAAFAPALDQDGDGIYHFTTISVESGLTVRLGADVLGSKPVVWLATGAVQIDGTLDLSGGDGHPRGAVPVRSIAGAGGYSGGAGETSVSPWQPGNGPGGGRDASRSAGHVVVSEAAAYGNDALLPILGGSGGSGGRIFGVTPNGAGGGAGGGAILIASSVSVTINGTITVKGGCGLPSNTSNNDPSGGHGSSGAIRLMSNLIDGTGFLNAGTVTQSACGNNDVAHGSRGRIRLESYNNSYTGGFDPINPSLVIPGLVFPPAMAPSVRIATVGGVAVPASPSGVFPPPDVTVNQAGTVTIGIEASYVPLFTAVELTLVTDSGAYQTVTSTPLNGTLETSTATADVVFPHGFSTIFVDASWTPGP